MPSLSSLYSDRHQQAILASERAIELSPGFALGHLASGMARLSDGDAVSAIEPLDRGLRPNPHDPQNPVWFNLLALARLFADDVSGAVTTARDGLKTRPDSQPMAPTLSCCLAASGGLDAARHAAHLAQALPQRAPDALGPLRPHNPRWNQRLQDLLAQVTIAAPDRMT